MKPPQLLRRDVHAALDLFANNLGDCAANSLTVRLVVIRFPLQFRVHHFKKSLGRAKLPTWVVRIRFVLRFI